ncbi:MAG: peptidoglycan-binding protein [Blautia sp.]|nr:peptidoglycan-binding protein [Blautia sp.]
MKGLSVMNSHSEKDPIHSPENVVPRKKLQIRIIKMDDQGPDVKLAQAALQCWGYSTIVSGIFGREMHDKIRDFQEKHGLPANGEIGSETWRALLTLPDKL